MDYKENVHRFAIKWIEKFQDEAIDYVQLVDHYLADGCESLGFYMDGGENFYAKYGNAVNDADALKEVIHYIHDIDLLGSAIYSRWRYFNHWAYDAAKILLPKNRMWFIIALRRLATLSEKSSTLFHGEPESIHLVSENVGYMPHVVESDEIEQRLTIVATGKVKFTAFYLERKNKFYETSRSTTFNIGPSVTKNILTTIGDCFSTEQIR